MRRNSSVPEQGAPLHHPADGPAPHAAGELA